MTLPSQLLQHIEPLVLVIARFSGLFMYAPIFSTSVIPAKGKALLVCMFALAAYPWAARAGIPTHTPDIATLALAVAGEVLIGLILGLFATLPLYGAQLAGLLVDNQMGLGLGAVYNPMLDTEGTVLGELLMYMSMGAFLLAGGLDAMMLGTLRTFEHIPIGEASLLISPLPTLIALISAGFELALRVASPVLCIILLETVATAFVAKTMPQLNIMSIGFPVKLLMGFFILIVSARAMGAAITEFVEQGLDVMLDWSGSAHTPISVGLLLFH